MWSLVPLLVVPLLIMFGFWWSNRSAFTPKEFLVLEAAMVVLLGIGFMVAREGSMTDVEIWSGRITGKPSGTQHCCHCRQECTSRNSKGECTSHREVCDHSYDNWWSLEVSTGDTLSVDSCSSSFTPPAIWSQARIGEPAAVEHHFRNYLLADPNSVFLQEGKDLSVPYPRVHGLYRIERAINLGTQMDARAWSRALDEALAELGPKDKVNVVVVATTNPDPTFAKDLQHTWTYGKLNDAIFVLGAPDGRNVTWAEVVQLPTAPNELRVEARTLAGLDLTDVKSLDRIVAMTDAHWHWSGLESLAYLGWAATPPTWALVVLYLLAVLGSVVGSQYMIQNDVFPTRRFRS
jgi:hypothetical protein